MRNTSPIGWPPVLAIKILRDKSFIPFIIAGITIFIPTVGLCVLIDSFYYGLKDFPVLTSYNFMQANLTEGLSKYFGTEPVLFYLIAVLPLIFTVAYPSVLASFVVYPKEQISKWRAGGEPPYMFFLTAFYLLVFSLIAHKEPRFLLPIVPFCALMCGYFITGIIKKSGPCIRKTVKAYLCLAIFVEVVMGLFFLNFQFRNWEIPAYLQSLDAAPHSIYTMQALDTPYYTWTHRHIYYDAQGRETNRTIVYRADKNPTYARKRDGVPTPLLHDEDFNSCVHLMSQLESGLIRPEYVILYEFTSSESFFAYEACMTKFRQIDLYDLEKTFVTDLGEKATEKFKHFRRKRFLYKLKS